MQPIARHWQRIRSLPAGRWLFSRALGLYIPYTGSMGASVEEMAAGYARVSFRDRRSVRNHLRSIHAVALVNLAELTGNLAMLYGMPTDARFIVSALSMEFKKKARGRIVAECSCAVPQSSDRREYDNPVVLRDSQGDIVATASIKSLIGPKR